MTGSPTPRPRPPRRTIAGIAATVIVIIALATPYGVLGPLVNDLVPDIDGPRSSPSPSAFVLGTPASPVPEPSAIPTRTPDPDSVVYDVPASIDPTGVADTTLAIQTYIASVPDGATIRFVPEARYRIEGTIHVQGRRG